MYQSMDSCLSACKQECAFITDLYRLSHRCMYICLWISKICVCVGVFLLALAQLYLYGYICLYIHAGIYQYWHSCLCQCASTLFWLQWMSFSYSTIFFIFVLLKTIAYITSRNQFRKYYTWAVKIMSLYLQKWSGRDYQVHIAAVLTVTHRVIWGRGADFSLRFPIPCTISPLQSVEH